MLLELGFLLLLVLSSIGVGAALLRLLQVEPENTSDYLALALPLGLGAQALATLALGELGLLTRLPLLLGLVGSLTVLLVFGRSLAQRFRAIPVRWPSRFSAEMIWDVLILSVVVATFLTALLPVTDGDALCYHLQVPKSFLSQRSVGFDPDLHETVYPLVTEMLYAIALAFSGPVACRLIQWVFGIVLALSVTALARPYLGSRARWAGGIALLVPAISNGMSAPLNDVALAAFCNAAIYACRLWSEKPSARTAILSGVLFGLAIGVKYPALVLLGVVGLAMTARLIGLRKPVQLLVFGASVLLIGGCWYLRSFDATGNPVHPFFRSVFGGAGLDEVLDPIKRPLPVTPWNLITAVVPITLDPARFDSFSHQFGPLFLLFLPALFLERPPKKLVGLVLVGFAFLTLCLTQRQSMRFVLPALGPFSVGVGWLASRWWDRKNLASRGLVGLLVACLCFEAGLAAIRPRHGLGVLLGRESADAYLTKREPTYPVGKWVDQNLPADVRIIGQDHRGFYFPRPYTMELAHRRRTSLGASGESPEAVVATLRSRGFTHLLLCPPEPVDAVEFDPALERLLRPWLVGKTPVYRQDLTDADGVLRHYALYDLSTEIASANPPEVRR